MEIILNNPFRILGLPVNSSEKIIKKNIQNFEIYLSVGQQPKRQETDFIFMGNVNRNNSNLGDTIRRIEAPKDRINYSLFWFSKTTSTDEEAFASLNKNAVEEAIINWESSIIGNSINVNNFTSYKNLGILYFYKSFKIDKIDLVSLRKAISLFGILLYSDDFWQLYSSHLNNSLLTSAVNRYESISYFFETLFKELRKKYNYDKDVDFLKNLIDHEHIPSEFKEKIITRLIYNKISFIESKIDKCKHNCNLNNLYAHRQGENLKSFIDDDICFIKRLLGETDYRLIMISDKIANELINCAILTFHSTSYKNMRDQNIETLLNYAKDLAAEKLLNYAKDYAMGDLTKKRLQENLRILKKATSSKLNNSIVSEFSIELEHYKKRVWGSENPYTVYKEFFNVLKNTLSRIDQNPDPIYRNIVLNLSAPLFRNCARQLANYYKDYSRAIEILKECIQYVNDPELIRKYEEDIILISENIFTYTNNSSDEIKPQIAEKEHKSADIKEIDNATIVAMVKEEEKSQKENKQKANDIHQSYIEIVKTEQEKILKKDIREAEIKKEREEAELKKENESEIRIVRILWFSVFIFIISIILIVIIFSNINN